MILKLKPVKTLVLKYKDVVIDEKLREYTFIGLSSTTTGDRCLILETLDQIMYGNASEFFMIPTGYIQISGDRHAVYDGDRVYHLTLGWGTVESDGKLYVLSVSVRFDDGSKSSCSFTNLLFEKPVVKHARWLNVYPCTPRCHNTMLFTSKEDADKDASFDRIDCICIEWNEQIIMKRCKLFTCWTDYPILELGDISGKVAPYRRVTVLSYDSNKYATIMIMSFDIIVMQIKIGYLYSSKDKLHYQYKMWWNVCVNPRKFERMINTVV